MLFAYHVAVYGDRVVPMDYISDRKREFSAACMRCVDNAWEGSVITPGGVVYSVSRSCRRARPVSGEAALAVVKRACAVLGVPSSVPSESQGLLF